ncbi:hypothetical protein IAT38_004621 [Cryptococcus sp. DSM 104549]
MGLAERKVKQRIGNDPRNLTWSGDKDRFSYKHMTALGWKDNTGLGSDASGNPNHIAVVRKSDNGGIGMARQIKEGGDLAAGAGQAGQGLEEVLRRLAASASASPSPAPVVEAEEKPKAPMRNKIASRQRHLASKRMASSDPKALAEILGVSVSSLPSTPRAGSPSDSAASTPAPEEKPAAEAGDERTSDEVVATSKLSVSDYFRQKMREKMLARQAAAGGASSSEGVKLEVKEEDLPASSLERLGESSTLRKPVGGTAWEGEKMTFKEEVKVEFDPSDSTAAIPKEESKAEKKARKEAKRLAKLQAAAGVKVKEEEVDPIHQAAEAVDAFEHRGEGTEKERKKREKKEKKAAKASEEAVVKQEPAAEEQPVEVKSEKKRKRDESGEGETKKSKKDKEGKKEKKVKVKKE